MKLLLALLVANLSMCGLAQGQETVISEAPSARIPDRPIADSGRPPAEPNQQIRRSIPTPDEEMEAAVSAFRARYLHVKQPRLLVLFNRQIEDNDQEAMTKTGKVTTGISGRIEGSEGNSHVRLQGGTSTFAPSPANPNAYAPHDLAVLRESFEYPLLQAGARLVDRDTAVRLHGLSEEAVFSYIDLPETQQKQVAGVAKYADVLITVKIEQGATTVRKVSGDYVVDAPRMVVRAISLKDAQVLATATTDDVRPSPQETVTTSRVALALMNKLAAYWR